MSKRNVSFIKPKDPSFLKKLKVKVGYQPGPDINTKKEVHDFDDDDREDDNDENPTVVVLKEGDLSQNEVDEIIKTDKVGEETLKEGKLLFRKPDKDSSKVGGKKSAGKTRKKESNMEKVKNKRLLSFDEEEDFDY
ncbi:KIAA1143 (predicted) [Pycnogonum litorale]